MTNKRLTIENLDNLEELNTEEVFSIQGGLLADIPIQEKLDISISIEEKLIYPDKPIPYPLPCYPYPLPYPCNPYPTKDGKLPWCAVIL